MNAESREMIVAEVKADTRTPRPRRTTMLRLVGMTPLSRYRPPHEGERTRPGPAPRPIAEEAVQAVVVGGPGTGQEQ